MFRRFVVLAGPASYLTSALFTLFTYVCDCFDISPNCGVTSPVKRCGKSRLLEVQSCLVRKPLSTANITAASLFRCVDSYSPTLLMDEMDTFLEGKDDLRGILNSGWRRALARVFRTVGADYEPRWFGTWCPKFFALIKNLPDTLEDRSILIKMQRKRKNESVERLRYASLFAELKELRQKCLRWGQDSEGSLKLSYPDLPPELDDRAKDNWEPLVSIADLCSLGAEAREAALELSGHQREDNEIGILLLRAIQRIFQETGKDRISSENLVKELTKRKGEPWPEWRRGDRVGPITQNVLANLLRPFEIRPKDVWIGKSLKGYRLKAFEKAFQSYTSHLNRETREDPVVARVSAQLQTARNPLPRSLENDLKPSTDAGSRGPRALKGGGGGKETLKWQDV